MSKWLKNYSLKSVFEYAMIILLCAIGAFVGISIGIQSCGDDRKVSVEAPEPESPTVNCGGSPAGSLRNQLCPIGQQGTITEICSATGVWLKQGENCSPVGGGGSSGCAVAFNPEISNIVNKSCANSTCHATFGTYDVAKAKANAFLQRVRATGAEHMPKQNNLGITDLTPDEISSIEKWASIGTPLNKQDCKPDQPSRGFITLDDQQQVAFGGAVSKGDNTKPFLRFMSAAHKVNSNATAQEMRLYWASVKKTLNSLAREEKDLGEVQILDEASAVGMIDIRDFGLTVNDWESILQAEPFDFIADTSTGKQLQQLTRTRQPWLHADVLADFAHNAQVYYKIMGFPQTLNEYLAQVGSNLVGDIQDKVDQWARGNRVGDVFFAGTNDSPLSDENRLVVFFEGAEGQCAITFDVINGQADTKTLLKSPLVAVGRNRFVQDGSETICEMKNGLTEWGLWGGNGARADAGPADLVTDFESNIGDPIIDIKDCSGCHSAGFRPIVEEIRDSYLRNGDINDIPLVEALYGSRQDISKVLNDFNSGFNATTAKIDLKVGDPDPIRYVSERMRRRQTLAEFCAFVFLPEDECRLNIDRSPNVRNQLGTLLQGGTVTFSQMVNAFPDVRREFRLGLDPVGG